MREFSWVVGIILLSFAWTAAPTLPVMPLISGGETLMLSSAAFAIPLEIVYFAGLGLALRVGVEAAPAGWYWRPFMHHELLSKGQRSVVLPFFYAGALAFVGVLVGMAGVVLGMLAGWRALA